MSADPRDVLRDALYHDSRLPFPAEQGDITGEALALVDNLVGAAEEALEMYRAQMAGAERRGGPRLKWHVEYQMLTDAVAPFVAGRKDTAA